MLPKLMAPVAKLYGSHIKKETLTSASIHVDLNLPLDNLAGGLHLGDIYTLPICNKLQLSAKSTLLHTIQSGFLKGFKCIQILIYGCLLQAANGGWLVNVSLATVTPVVLARIPQDACVRRCLAIG